MSIQTSSRRSDHGEAGHGGIKNPMSAFKRKGQNGDGQLLYQGSVPVPKAALTVSVSALYDPSNLMQSHELRLIAWSYYRSR